MAVLKMAPVYYPSHRSRATTMLLLLIKLSNKLWNGMALIYVKSVLNFIKIGQFVNNLKCVLQHCNLISLLFCVKVS